MAIAKHLSRSLKDGDIPDRLPKIEEAAVIPRIIHQTFKSKNLPVEFQKNIDQLKALNPEWEHRLYDDDDIKHFILDAYGTDILAYFNRINPRYGAAKADLFRYLLLYKCGGVYLDIKSTFTKPIDQVLKPDDRYLLAKWSNKPGEKREGWGKPKELEMIPGGEFQQWHIVATPGHPFLKAVIERVLHNIDCYKPWLHGTGGNGVLRLTGPIAYTLAIHPLLPSHPHRLVNDEAELCLEYSMLKSSSHKPLFNGHYTTLTESVVHMSGVEDAMGKMYSLAKKTKRRMSQLISAIPCAAFFLTPVLKIAFEACRLPRP
jgi:hypothetical protein